MRPSLDILLLFFVFFQTSTSTFIITWGKLTDYSECGIIQSEDCFGSCENDTSCLIAHINEETCYNCDSTFSSKIQSLDKSQANGNKIGFKAVVDDECPISPNTTFTLEEDFILEYSEGYWQLISMTTTTVGAATCNEYKSERENGDWCMMYTMESLPFDNAQELCAGRHNGALSGLETKAELDNIIEAIKSDYWTDLHKSQANIWIGMKRRSECVGDNSNATECIPSVPNAYEWTDNFTTGTEMMMNNSWYQSDYSDDKQCVKLVFHFDEWIYGEFDNANCNDTTDAFFCGYKL